MTLPHLPVVPHCIGDVAVVTHSGRWCVAADFSPEVSYRPPWAATGAIHQFRRKRRGSTWWSAPYGQDIGSHCSRSRVSERDSPEPQSLR